MKKTIAVILTAMLLVGMSACGGSGKSDKPVLKVGMECNYAPFNWTQSKKSKTSVKLSSGGYADGYDVQIAKKIADELGMELEIVKTEWDGLALALESGKIDAIIAGMSPTAERAITIDFTQPYYNSELVMVVKKDSVYANASTLADFSGAKITGQLSTFHYSVIDQIPGVDKQAALDSFPTMVAALKSGKIDGYVSEKPGALAAVAANSELAFVEFSQGEGFVASEEDTAVSVGLKKGNELTSKIDEILKGISRDEREELMRNAIENQPVSN